MPLFLSEMDRELTRKTRLGIQIRRWVWPFVILLGIVTVIVWLTGLLRPGLDRARIRTARVERGSIEAVLSASGVVEPAAEQTLSSPIDGRVLRVLQQPGAVLKVGDPILDLDLGDSRLEIDRLRGEIDKATARRRETELKLEEKLIENRSQREIKALEIEQLGYEEEQNRRLHQEGLLSETVLRQTEVRTRRARIQLDAIDESIENAGRSLEEQISSLDTEITVLEGELAASRGRLERATPKAEKEGVLTWVVQTEGASVRRGDALARIADLDQFRIEARLSDLHAARLRRGQAVRVLVGGETIDGGIERILPEIDQGTLKFRVELADPGHSALRANLRVDVLVVTDHREDVLKLSKGPYANGAGTTRVLVVDTDHTIRRSVRFGLVGHEHYEVLEGLEEGEEVVISDVRDFLHLEQVPFR